MNQIEIDVRSQGVSALWNCVGHPQTAADGPGVDAARVGAAAGGEGTRGKPEEPAVVLKAAASVPSRRSASKVAAASPGLNPPWRSS